jgi:uncharacterized phage-associated protein
MPTASQVAEWIVRYRAEDLAAPVDPMSLEKLVYYAQCFYLVVKREKLFDDEIRAWRFGPVVRSVYDQYAKFAANPIILKEGDWPPLSEEVQRHLEEVVGFFGRLTAIELSNATHEEGPWANARLGYNRHDNSDVLMHVEDLRRYYCSLACDGEEALSKHELLDVTPEPQWGSYYVAGICARRYVSHPFYDIELAKRLSEPVPKGPELAPEFYEPVKEKDYVDVGDVSQLTPEEIMNRVSNAIGGNGARSDSQGDLVPPKRP